MDPIDVSPVPQGDGSLVSKLPALSPATLTSGGGDAHNPFRAGEDPFGQTKKRNSLRKRIASAVAGIGALLAKVAGQLKALILLLPKAKLLLTAGSALVSVAAYSLLWGW